MSQGPLCPNLSQKVQKEVSQMANRNLSCAMLYRWFKCKLKPPKNSPKIQQNQLVTLKVHIRKTLDPRYEGTYRVVSIKGNQVELARNGTVTPIKWAHISHVKPLLRADEIIEQLPKDSAFARKTKLALNPDKIPDLEWKRATELNTPTS